MLGRDIVQELGIRRAAKRLMQLAPMARNEDGLILLLDGCQNIVSDPAHDRLVDADSGFFFSFRYGGTYLSASRETAGNYALLYPQGGEALTTVLSLYKQLSAEMPELKLDAELASLQELALQPAKPILVEARDILISSLRAEQGGGMQSLLERIEEALQDPEFYDGLVGQHNFELLEAVPIEQLRFYEVAKVTEFDDAGGSRQVFSFLESKPQ